MNLLYITHHRRSKIFARAEPWARELARRGHKVTVLCLSERDPWRVTIHEEPGLRIVETPDLLPGRLRSGWDPWSVWWRMGWLRDRRYDLVHLFESRPSVIFPALRLLRQAPTPLAMDWNDWWGRGGLIVENRPHWYRWLFGGIETFFEEHYRRRADATTVICQALADRAIRLGVRRESVQVIRGGVDVDRFRVQDPRAHRERFGLPPRAVIAGMSLMDVNHDAAFALEAMRHAAARRPDLILMIVGRPPAGLAQHLAGLGLRLKVKNPGCFPHDDPRLPDALSCADFFVLPFTNRVANVGRWPHKLGEYMACGRPVVTHLVGDVGDLMRRHAIGLIAPETPEGFAARMVELAAHPTVRAQYGQNARRVAESEHAWSVVADRVENVYTTLLEKLNHAP